MKIELAAQKPEHYKESWEGQYSVFSHYEFSCGIPHVLCAITTYKENGKPNVCFHAWNCFQGDGDGYFAIMAGINKASHTYADIERTGEFCVNFLSEQYYDRLMATIQAKEDADEFEAGGFTVENSSYITSPRIKESFLTFECKKEHMLNLTVMGRSNLVIGRVINMAIEEDYSKGLDKKYGGDGFMLNIDAPVDVKTGEGNLTGVATLKIDRTF